MEAAGPGGGLVPLVAEDLGPGRDTAGPGPGAVGPAGERAEPGEWVRSVGDRARR